MTSVIALNTFVGAEQRTPIECQFATLTINQITSTKQLLTVASRFPQRARLDSFPSAGHPLAGFFILKIALAAVLLAFCGWIAWAISVSGSTVRDDIALSVPNHAFPHPGETPLRVAVISDLHVADSIESYGALRRLVQDILASEPSFILLLGDYTRHPDSVSSLSQHASRVGELLGQLSRVPRVRSWAIMRTGQLPVSGPIRSR